MIIGTAGHVDHGKTSLVRALTGQDTDRLKEEKARGITIELGFAYMPGGGGGKPIGFVDVPGHERFVRTMVAGAAAIDFALLVIAGDDGPMPQTREHLAILDLLGIARGLVVVTKIDRIDSARRRSVLAEVTAALSGSPFAESPVHFVSSQTGEGVPALRDALVAAADDTALTRQGGLFRMSVDRAFNLAGIGTVATGTALSGTVRVDDELVILPEGRRARVRSLHAQNRDAAVGAAGERCALALAGSGISTEVVHRGGWLCAAEGPSLTSRCDVELALLPFEGKAFRDWLPVHFHCGASDVPARLVGLEDGGLRAGHRGFAQVALEQPLPLRNGDRFVVRDASGQQTLGGGIALDPRAPLRRRRSPQRLARLAAMQARDPQAAFAALLALEPGFEAIAPFAQDRGLPLADMDAICRALGLETVRSAEGTIACNPARWAAVCDQTSAMLAEFHAEHPELPGLAGEKLRLHLGLDTPMFAAVRDRLVKDGVVAVRGHWLHRPGHVAELSTDHRRIASRLSPHIAAMRFRPPRVRDLGNELGVAETVVRQTCKALARTGELVEVAHDHFFLRTTVSEMAEIAADLTRHADAGLFSAADFRDRLDNGRKVAIQILEYFDAHGLTLRKGDLRRVIKAPSAIFGQRADAA